MPPAEQNPLSNIKWNEVTWYSKLGAIILFVGIVPALSFYIGTQYELVRQNIVLEQSSQEQSSPSLSTQAMIMATSTVGVVVDNNNLFINGQLIQSDISKMLGLSPSTLGQAPVININGALVGHDGFYYEGDYWPFDRETFGTTDIYTAVATSTNGQVAFVYAREEQTQANFNENFWPNIISSAVLIYSPAGLLYRKDLNAKDISAGFNPVSADICYFDNTEVDFAVGNIKGGVGFWRLSIPAGQVSYIDSPPSTGTCESFEDNGEGI